MTLNRAEYGSQRSDQPENVNFEPIIRGLRKGSRYQIGWFFGKIRNGLWPPPLFFGKSCCKLFIFDMVANKELIEQIWSNYSIKDNRRISLELTFLKWRTMAWNGAAAVSARKRITSGRYWQELQLYKQAIDNHNFLSADLDRAMPGKPI